MFSSSRIAVVVSVLSVLVSLAGCSGCEGDGRIGDPSSDGDGAVDAVDTAGDAIRDVRPETRADVPDSAGDDGDAAGGDVDTGCPSSRACGDQCCADDEVCEQNQCLPPCSGTRCGGDGELCCTGEEVCIFDGCQTPGESCENSFQCPEDSYCESTIGSCLPESAQTSNCTFTPEVGEFTPDRENAFDGVETNGGTYDNAITTPVVADIDDDDLPEIATIFYRGESLTDGLVAVVDGEDLSLLDYAAVGDVNGDTAGLAVADLDPQTPELELVVPRDGGGLVALKYDASEGELTEWWTKTDGAIGNIGKGSAPSIADLDADGSPEIVLGFSALTAEGDIWNGLDGGRAGGQTGSDAVTAVVDLDRQEDEDGDRRPEIVSGNRAIRTDGSTLWDASDRVSDGFPAVGDLTGDAEPEVVNVTDGEVYVLDGLDGSTVFGPKPVPGDNRGGPPTIADFDGDGDREFAAAGEDGYAVYDTACTGSDPDASKCPTETTDGILWQKTTQDSSSARTGSSVFDFEGDGQAEVIYNDECFLRVYDGATGEVLYERANSTRTGAENPIVADVDRDFNSEIVVASNNDQIERDECEANPDYPEGGTTGLFVYADADDNWVPTRAIWNQHAYHVTNILEDGTVPATETVHYRRDDTNAFRLNVQPSCLVNGADLVVSEVGFEGAACGQLRTVEIRVTVENRGSLGVGPNVPVDVTSDVGGSETLIATVETSERLLPGQSETVTLEWQLPEAATSGSTAVSARVDPEGGVNECESDNNGTSTTVEFGSLDYGRLEAVDLSLMHSCPQGDPAIEFELRVENTGGGAVPADVPVVLEDPDGETLVTVRTSGRLAAGESEVLAGEWETPGRFQNSSYDVTAVVDPSGEAHVCGTSSVGSVEVDCELGQ